MKAVTITNAEDTEGFKLENVQTPETGGDEVLIKVNATALNRADILQRKGLYPPPPGESDILGLEVAGEIVETGNSVSDWQVGDPVMALLGGGGYAQYVNVHHQLLMPLPPAMSVAEAAGIPEAFLTAWQALVWQAKLKEGESVLIHAGASGVGTAAIQIARVLGAEVIVTASKSKHPLCQSLGANLCVDYKTEEFAKVLANNQNPEVDVVIDFIGAPFFGQNLECLRTDGRMVMLGLMGGTTIKSQSIAPVLFKRLNIMGSTLRSRELDYKIRLTRDFIQNAIPLFESRQLKPVIDSVFDWENVGEAHRHMEANKNQGKIILKVNH